MFHFLHLPSYALLRVTFCVTISFFPSKGTTVFCKLELHMFLDKKTLLRIWLNPRLNLTIFRGTGQVTGNIKEKRVNGRLQNSPYFCVFEYARAVKQKVWCETRVRLLRHSLPISLLILRRKPTVLQSS